MLKLSELWQVLESEARPVQMKGGPKSPKWQEMVVASAQKLWHLTETEHMINTSPDPTGPM
ncbi:hypothetical protein C8J55DRAFT_555404 [Lentinula edodes]|uniref:Uncharacterized protein n=1 Tax=Lentinula lateritia TaxID=40482 RepID=A0A9W9AZE6_9AGAR|nr:hypothetical protein C8J55DRAFT_555395 [Lentinula edodes]KAJ4494010.1 hypothetical protein C8J55DRAFT_555404 [Lentinula edodes]